MSIIQRDRVFDTVSIPVTASQRRVRIVVALVFAACVALGGMYVRPRQLILSTTVTGDAALAARVKPYLTGPLDRVSVATIDGDRVTYANFGAQNDIAYELGSISKTFTGMLLADAIERGEVTADTRVGDVLPLAGSAVADVTLAELASHRSGLPRQSTRLQDVIALDLRYLANRDPYVDDAAGVVAQARAVPLRNRGHFRYSNLGIGLLGQALAAASGKDYEHLIEERIFRPLGMTTSSVPLTADHLPDDAPVGYSVGGRRAAPWTMNGTAPAGGIRSTTADMVRYAQALLNATAPGMDALTPRWQAFGEHREVGYAWITEEHDGQTLTWHTGETGGFASMLVLDRANHVGKHDPGSSARRRDDADWRTAMTLLISTIFLSAVSTFTIWAYAPRALPQSRLAARDRWGLITGFALAVTAFAIVSLPLEEVVVPGTVWFGGVGLLAVGVSGAVLRWPDLAWYRGRHPRRRAIGVIAIVGFCALVLTLVTL